MIKKILLLVTEIIFAIGVKTIFSGCGPMENGMYMACHTAENILFGIALFNIALSAVSLFVKNKKINIVIGAVIAISSLAAIILPGNVLHLCMMKTMRCQSIMKTFDISINGLGLIIAGVGIVLDAKKVLFVRKKTEQTE